MRGCGFVFGEFVVEEWFVRKAYEIFSINRA
jgi:hypothetical protein